MTLYLVKVTPKCLAHVIEAPTFAETLLFGTRSLKAWSFRKKKDRLELDYRSVESALDEAAPLREVLEAGHEIDYELCYGNVAYHSPAEMVALAGRLAGIEVDDPELGWVLEHVTTAVQEKRAMLVGVH